MYQLVAVGCLTLCCYSLAEAQSKPKPNLAGTWIVDSAKSEKMNNLFEDSESSMTIQQNDPEIRMARQFKVVSKPVTFVFFSDDREENHKNPITGMETKARTKWDGDKLVIHYTGSGVSPMGVRYLNVIEELKLSKDGNTLTKKIILVVQRNAPDRVNAVPVSQSNQEYKKVYNRASE
jgi:hypothetical protein